MGRKVFAPGVQTRTVNIDAIAKARSEAAYERLLARPAKRFDRLAALATHYAVRNPPAPGLTALGDNEAVVRNYGFQPLAWFITHAWYAVNFGTEIWVDRTGSIVLEVMRNDTTSTAVPDGRRTLAAYFTDGSSLVMWDQDADLETLAAPHRESMHSSGYFPQDMRDFTARLDQLVASGKEVLRVWSVATCIRRFELHARYMVSDGAREAEQVLAVGGLIVLALGLAMNFLIPGWFHTWAFGAAWAGGWLTSKVFRRLGLYLRFENWLHQRFGM